MLIFSELLLAKMKRVRPVGAPVFFILIFGAFAFLPGCEFLRKFSGEKKAVVAAQERRSVEPAAGFLTPGEKYSFYLWVANEMQEQVFARPVKSRADLDKWANVLAQRGSMEGVYHGLVLSTEYAALEKGKADLKAVRFFASEMAALDHPLLHDSHETVRAAGAEYAKAHLATPLFTLKRLLGERILVEAEKRSADPEQLASWFASFATKWSKLGITFGAEQRAGTNEAYYFRWARANSLGLIQWELLNRAHRVLNHFGAVAATPPGK